MDIEVERVFQAVGERLKVGQAFLPSIVCSLDRQDCQDHTRCQSDNLQLLKSCAILNPGSPVDCLSEESNQICVEAEPGYNVGACHSVSCAPRSLFCLRDRARRRLRPARSFFVGLLLRAWASGHIRKNDALAISGPYAYTRNPLYLGSFILGLGFTIGFGQMVARNSLCRAVSWHLFAGNARRIRDAGTTIWRKFSRVRRSGAAFFAALDALSQRRRRGQHSISRLYLRYREYRAALGLLIAWGLLVFKAYYLK